MLRLVNSSALCKLSPKFQIRRTEKYSTKINCPCPFPKYWIGILVHVVIVFLGFNLAPLKIVAAEPESNNTTPQKINAKLEQFFNIINSYIQNNREIETTSPFCPKEFFAEEQERGRNRNHCNKIKMAHAVNPSHYVRTIAGIQMPKIIYGTAWKKERTADLVVEAIRAGFRGIDTACQPKHYNEKGVGEALKRLANEGIPRDTLYIQTKFTSVDGQDPNTIPYDRKANLMSQVQQSLNASLSNLGTSYLDCLILHSPLRTNDETMQVWRTFESFTEPDLSGVVKVRQLGISNCYSLASFQKLYDGARVKPAVLQNRLYADTDYDRGLRDFCKTKGIFYQSFWTLSANPTILRNKNVQAIATEKGKTVEQIFFAYLISTGVITPLTGTTSRQHMLDDLEAVNISLTREQINVFEDLMM